ncbi:MAG: ATP-binding protein [Promethearchaeota archaeon]
MKTETKLRLLFQEWIQYSLPHFVKREFDYNLIKNRKIQCIIGSRRVGKTYLQFQIITHLLKKGCPRTNLIYFNFEDERLFPLNGDELTQFLPTLYEYHELNPSYPIYLFLDEIQNIPFWEKWIRRIHDKENNIYLFITGSSSQLASKEIGNALAGRTITTVLYPFTFSEFLQLQDFTDDQNIREKIPKSINDYKKLSERDIAWLQKKLNLYLDHGGFPEVIIENNNSIKTRILQDYYNSIFYRDILARFKIKNPKLIEILLNLLINNMARKISFSKLEHLIKSLGYKVSKTTLIDYTKYAENVFLVNLIEIFSYTIKDRLQYPKKVYCIDSGLANAISLKFREENWALYENVVFIELKRRNFSLFYWKNSLHEIDFVVMQGLDIIDLIQVSFNIDDKKTVKSEKEGLIAAMKALRYNSGTIITKNQDKNEKIDEYFIRYIPLYKWLLGIIKK